MLKKVSIKIDERLMNITIKDVLLYFHVGRSKIEEIRSNKRALLNGEVVDLSTRVSLGDEITFLSEELKVKESKKEIKVLYEDDNFIAVYKEKGLLVHSDGVSDDVLIFRVAAYLEDGIVYPVNRIDVDTSGIVLFAKHFLSSCIINNLIESHCVIKEYLLTVKGILKKKSGTLEFDLGRDRHNSKKMIVKCKEGLKAITHYEVLKEYSNTSLIKAQIVTGRKHQIRVSFAHINHPIVGDRLYGDPKDKNELNLEASHLYFIDPFSGNLIDIKTEYFLEALGLKNN